MSLLSVRFCEQRFERKHPIKYIDGYYPEVMD